MSTKTQQPTPRDGAHATLPGGPAPADVVDARAALERLDRVMSENVGLANEVLRSYEQLNLVFEVTHQIAEITDVAEIERILVGQIGRLIGADQVHVVASDDARRVYHTANGAAHQTEPSGPISETLRQKVAEARAARHTVASETPDGSLVVSPLSRMDSMDVVVAMREQVDRAFSAGDLMLIESMLSFGGKIIANCELHEKLRRMSFDVTRALVSAIDKKDNYTSGHSERVGFLARMIGERLGVSTVDLQWLEWSGILHDVGKIGIREEVLGKPGRLTEEEFAHIKEHPRMGYEILKPIAEFDPVLQGVLRHHENPDGTGYPDGLRGDEIPLFARIIHVADVFDALTSNRSYRAAFGVDQACDIIRKDSGSKLDTQATEAFLAALEQFRQDQPHTFAHMFVQGRGQ
ncbi:MAG: HD-GYP domain-containing protein [Phycisphaerales bacterium]|nr:HD-GYP domain-containing protein [Phycisphaerales bacterium]